MICKMLFQVVVLLSYVLVLNSTAASAQSSHECFQECPRPMDIEVPQDIVLQPGKHFVLCLDYQFYQPIEQSVALYIRSGGFCSTVNQFLDPNTSNPTIECRLHTVNNTGSNCVHTAAVVQCLLASSFPQSPVTIPPTQQPPTDRSKSSRSKRDTGSGDYVYAYESDSFEEMGLVFQLEKRNVGDPGLSFRNVLLNVSWENFGCNIEETHDAPNDTCSGIGPVTSGVGTNTTWFIVENTGIQGVGNKALLVSDPDLSPFCGTLSINVNSGGQQILCEVEEGDAAYIASVGINQSLNELKEYIAFRCEGDWNRVDAGEARIIFQRNLSLSESNDQCKILTVSRPYLSSYASFPVYWAHGEDNVCDQMTRLNCDVCLGICVTDPIANGPVCDTLVEFILSPPQASNIPLGSEDIAILLRIFESVSNAPSIGSLRRVVSLFDSLTEAMNRTATIWPPNEQKMLYKVLDRVLNWRDLWNSILETRGHTGRRPASVTYLNRLEQFLHLTGEQATEDNFKWNGTHIQSVQIKRVVSEDIDRGMYTLWFPECGTPFKTFAVIPKQLLCKEIPENGFTYNINRDCSSSVATALVQSLPIYLDMVTNVQTSLVVNTPLLMLSIPDQANARFPIKEFPIELHISPLTLNETFAFTHSCMYWDFNKSAWSAEGVSTTVADDGSYICTTTHLTSFAVLVGLTEPSNKNETTVENRVLSIITYTGCGISLLCLVLSLSIFVVCGKRLKKGVLLYIHVNFCLALCLALLLFITCIETAVSVQVLCTVVAAVLHYLFLCAFCWMLAEGIMLYILVVKVFGKLASRWYYLLPVGWGLPIPIVAVSVGLRYTHYGTDHFCWLSTDNGVIWAFVGPMLLIVLINSVFLVLTVCSLLRSRKYGGAERGVSAMQLAKSGVKSTLILLPLLGLTWVLGIFAFNQQTTVFAWLFTIFNSLQGCMFFILHVLRNNAVSSMIKKILCCSCGSKKKHSAISKENSTNLTNGSTSATNSVGLSYSEVDKHKRMLLDMGRTFSQTSTDSSVSTATIDLSTPV